MHLFGQQAIIRCPKSVSSQGDSNDKQGNSLGRYTLSKEMQEGNVCFSVSALLSFGSDHSSAVGAVWCTEGC